MAALVYHMTTETSCIIFRDLQSFLMRPIDIRGRCLERAQERGKFEGIIADCEQENWLERLSAAQELLGCERDPAPHLSTGAPIMERLRAP